MTGAVDSTVLPRADDAVEGWATNATAAAWMVERNAGTDATLEVVLSTATSGIIMSTST